MAMTLYPHQRENRKEHVSLTSQVVDLRNKIVPGERPITLDVMEFPRD
jgi:hypothetical protein